ncbi:MAG TPA: mycothiol conjugate amidase Mca [Acidimicrobiales bacterium]|nr:mycothiol conjugate amidase Mca [Acidimicrobiales bacterium]
MAEPLSLLTVHAHPDDEASKGASTVAKYKSDGVRTTLVCCTGGEEGDILNPAMDTPEVRERIDEVRRDELALAARIIGYDRVVMLGYRDSGMPDSEANADPRCFAKADPDEAVSRLVEVIRAERPQVVVTYADDQEGYPHPDHLMVHDISLPAFELAGDPEAYPGLGRPWQPLKLYYVVWSRARMLATHAKFTELGLESPFTEQWFERPSQDHRITTQVPTDGFQDVRLEALLAHATQVDPASPFWFGLPREVSRGIHPFDDYILARSLVDVPEHSPEAPESDLFAGLRA